MRDDNIVVINGNIVVINGGVNIVDSGGAHIVIYIVVCSSGSIDSGGMHGWYTTSVPKVSLMPLRITSYKYRLFGVIVICVQTKSNTVMANLPRKVCLHMGHVHVSSSVIMPKKNKSLHISPPGEILEKITAPTPG